MNNKPIISRVVTALLAVMLFVAAVPASAKKKNNNQGNAAAPSLLTSYYGMIQNYGGWTDVEMPVRLRLSKPKSISLSGRATIVRDKYLHISLRFFGFEVGALTVTPDSVYAYEKRGRRYVAEGLDGLLRGFPATLANVQAMLLGRPFIPGRDMITSADNDCFDFSALDDADLPDAWLMTSKGVDLRGATCMWVVDKTLLAMIVTTESGAMGSLTYSDIVSNTAAGAVASETLLQAAVGEHEIEAAFEWDLRRAKWNSGIDPQVKIPSGYTRIPASSLLKMIEKL